MFIEKALIAGMSISDDVAATFISRNRAALKNGSSWASAEAWLRV